MVSNNLKLHFLDESLCVYRFRPGIDLPSAVWDRPFCSVTKTENELSVVVSGELGTEMAATAEYCSAGWVAFFVEGPLPHDMVGVMAGLSQCIAETGCSIFAIATYDTDYILVPEDKLSEVKNALERACYSLS